MDTMIYPLTNETYLPFHNHPFSVFLLPIFLAKKIHKNNCCPILVKNIGKCFFFGGGLRRFINYIFAVGGEMQNIVYGEFLPTILGKKYMHKYNLLAEDNSKVHIVVQPTSRR